MSEPRLSVLVVARNEQESLPACLDSAAFADEVVVVLDRSTDGSRDVAQTKGAKVFEGAWPNEGDRRNFAIAQCTGEWILELDADERISDELRRELEVVLTAAPPGYFEIPFHNYFCGVWVKQGWGAYNGVSAKSCLFSQGAKHWGDGEVHPTITLKGQKNFLTGHIDHYVDQSIEAMIQRLNWYSSGAAKNAQMHGKYPSLFTTIRRVFSRFARVYWFRNGYTEGWRGFALAMFSGLYPLLTYIKIQDIKSRKD
jgi:glycosyltransferase involved in cell wall biosynthesis